MIRRQGIGTAPSSLASAGRILAGAALGFVPAEVVHVRSGRLVPREPFPVPTLERELGAEEPSPSALQQLRTVLLLDFVGGIAATHYGSSQKVTLTESSARLLLATIRHRHDVAEEFNGILDELYAAAHRVVEADGFDEILIIEQQIADRCFPALRFTVREDVRSAVSSYVGPLVTTH